MDFALDEELLEVCSLAEDIFTGRASVDRVVEVERHENGFDASLWQTLAQSGMIGIPLPEEAGGSGLGVLGLVALLEQQGRRVAPVPLWSTLALAALPLAEFGTPAQQQSWLPGLLDGSQILTGAFDAAPGNPVGVRVGTDGWSGEVPGVPGLPVAAAVLVPALDPDGAVKIAIVPTDRSGVDCIPEQVTGWGTSGRLRLSAVQIGEDDLLPGDGGAILSRILSWGQIALAAVQLGVCSEAVAITAEYTSQRVQFGRPLSTNQAVAVRAADAHLDTENIRLTTYRAAWLLDQGRTEEAVSAAMVAKWWAAKGGLRVVHATQHLHGGIGADIDYPIHRYFLWGTPSVLLDG